MSSQRQYGTVVIVALLMLVGSSALAIANPTSSPPPAPDSVQKSCGIVGCKIKAKRGGDAVGDDDSKISDHNADDSAQARKVRAAKAALEARIAKYERASGTWYRCMNEFTPTAAVPAPSCGPRPAVPDDLTLSLPVGFNVATPPITNTQAGAIATARLKIPTVAPGIGPSPELNRWKMAAVGYPLWFWADGPTHVGPVSDSVGGLSVSLEAKVTKVTFRMGDGKTVNCAGRGQKWTRAVKPGVKSPSCGYSYTKPSLPEGPYRVAAIANWAVTWTVNDESGVINVPAVDTAELPVGELQVLVR